VLPLYFAAAHNNRGKLISFPSLSRHQKRYALFPQVLVTTTADGAVHAYLKRIRTVSMLIALFGLRSFNVDPFAQQLRLGGWLLTSLAKPTLFASCLLCPVADTTS